MTAENLHPVLSLLDDGTYSMAFNGRTYTAKPVNDAGCSGCAFLSDWGCIRVPCDGDLHGAPLPGPVIWREAK